MQKNVVISENVLVDDLGTGRSYVNLNRSVQETEDGLQIIAGEQYIVPNPVTRDKIIDVGVKEHFSNGASEAAIRKGIIDRNDADFVAFNMYVENLKTELKNEEI